MGMSIEEHIGVIEDLKSTMSVCMSEPEKIEICTSLSVAMDIMRKYQKIEQILSNNGYWCNELQLRDIRKVLDNGMTIDEIIKELEWALANNTIEDVESAFKYILAIHMAIDTMRKYQKIEQIVKAWNDMNSFDSMLKISEVLEDGKID